MTNESSNTNPEAFEILKGSRPHTFEGDPSVEHSSARAALFEEITMNEVTDSAPKLKRAAKPQARFRLAPVAAGALAVALVGGGLYSISDSAPSAYAQVNSAMVAAADLDSGQVLVRFRHSRRH